MKKATFHRLVMPDYSGTESLNTICTNISFSGRDMKKIVFTSCAAGEGKSYMAMQVLQNLTRRGKRVVFVDADMRRSYLINRFGLTTDGEWQGLAHYLAGYCGIDDIIYETNFYGTCVIPVGRDVATPVPLLTSPYFSELLETLADQFDMILVDAPPVGLVVDAAEIARNCDGAVFVVEYNKTHRREMMEAKQQILQSGCPILGAILNKVTFDSLSAKKYYNKSYYSHYNSEYYRRSKGGKK